MNAPTNPAAKFQLGQLVATPNAHSQLTHEDILHALLRYQTGDWGDVGSEDGEANDAALAQGTRLLSAYQAANGTKVWIITEADRSVTTVLLPEDY